MNYKSIGIVIILAALGWYFFLLPSPTNYPSDGENVIALGDSITVGVGTENGNNYASLLSQQLSINIINEGKNGDTTKNALERLPQVLQNDPKVVIVFLGGNDYLIKTPREKIFANLEQIIQKIHEAGAVTLLVGLGKNIPFDAYESDYKTLAKQYGTAYVPNVLEGILNNPELMADEIHPNNAGHALIAKRIFPTLKKLVK